MAIIWQTTWFKCLTLQNFSFIQSPDCRVRHCAAMEEERPRNCAITTFSGHKKGKL